MKYRKKSKIGEDHQADALSEKQRREWHRVGRRNEEEKRNGRRERK
jgi:hypothetical protein